MIEQKRENAAARIKEWCKYDVIMSAHIGIGIGIMHCRKGLDEPQKGNCPATVLVINNEVNMLLPK